MLRRGQGPAFALRFAGARLADPAAGLPAGYRRVFVVEAASLGVAVCGVLVGDADTGRPVLGAADVTRGPPPGEAVAPPA